MDTLENTMHLASLRAQMGEDAAALSLLEKALAALRAAAEGVQEGTQWSLSGHSVRKLVIDLTAHALPEGAEEADAQDPAVSPRRAAVDAFTQSNSFRTLCLTLELMDMAAAVHARMGDIVACRWMGEATLRTLRLVPGTAIILHVDAMANLGAFVSLAGDHPMSGLRCRRRRSPRRFWCSERGTRTRRP